MSKVRWTVVAIIRKPNRFDHLVHTEVTDIGSDFIDTIAFAETVAKTAMAFMVIELKRDVSQFILVMNSGDLLKRFEYKDGRIVETVNHAL